MPLILFLFTILTRIPFISTYIYHMDSGHFALALDHYSLVLHQPHPPGYFLYILLGRLFRPVIGDANTTLVVISILFSALTVVIMYYLGKEILNEKLGLLAAFIVLTSPNFWFHGEVALSYASDAFFSALIGLLCWRVYQGKVNGIFHAAAALAISSGFRQNTGVFLFPLWLFAVRMHRFRSIAAGVVLFTFLCTVWFLPMVQMTGGIAAYQEAFHELWLFHTGHNNVFEKGLHHALINMEVVFIDVFYNLAVLLPLILLAFYLLIRKRQLSLLLSAKSLFIACWMAPTLAFYLLVFISGNPGYGLILLPPLALIATAALAHLSDNLPGFSEKYVKVILAAIVISLNAGVFFCASAPVTYREIRDHDASMRSLLASIKKFDPRDTVLFADPYTFFSFRHVMVYLPEYSIWQVDVRTSASGERRRQFGGMNGMSVLAEHVTFKPGTTRFAAIVLREPSLSRKIPRELIAEEIAPNIFIVSGPLSKALSLYPELLPYWDNAGQTNVPTTHTTERKHSNLAAFQLPTD